VLQIGSPSFRPMHCSPLLTSLKTVQYELLEASLNKIINENLHLVFTNEQVFFIINIDVCYIS